MEDGSRREGDQEGKPQPADTGAPGGPPPQPSKVRDILNFLLVMTALGAFVAGSIGWVNAAREKELGKPCHRAADCIKGTTCLLEIADDRTVEAGYCTFKCSDASDCKNGMRCGEAAEIGSQGAKWDGMMGKSEKVCLKP